MGLIHFTELLVHHSKALKAIGVIGNPGFPTSGLQDTNWWNWLDCVNWLHQLYKFTMIMPNLNNWLCTLFKKYTNLSTYHVAKAKQELSCVGKGYQNRNLKSKPVATCAVLCRVVKLKPHEVFKTCKDSKKTGYFGKCSYIHLHTCSIGGNKQGDKAGKDSISSGFALIFAQKRSWFSLSQRQATSDFEPVWRHLDVAQLRPVSEDQT